jgi:hypothetical protein
MSDTNAVPQPTRRCQCGIPLVYEQELDYDTCEGCMEAQVERRRERDEWNHFHSEG